MQGGHTEPIDTIGLAACGIWVRRLRGTPSLLDEALGLAQVLRTWNLSKSMSIDRCGAVSAEISSHRLQPVWVHLIEVEGARLCTAAPLPNHPLSHVAPGQTVRILAPVDPARSLPLGALVETADRRRLIWLQQPPDR